MQDLIPFKVMIILSGLILGLPTSDRCTSPPLLILPYLSTIKVPGDGDQFA